VPTIAGFELSIATLLNCVTLLNETAANCSYQWYSYWTQLELHNVSKFNVSKLLERLQDYTGRGCSI